MDELTEQERSTLTNACYVANERFRQDVKEIEASNLPDTQKGRLVATFEKQIAETSAVLEKLET